jgi:curved DNA-binding protein CbpA
MTASTADYYGILGLTSDATLADVKKAYRKPSPACTPDRMTASRLGTAAAAIPLQAA